MVPPPPLPSEVAKLQKFTFTAESQGGEGIEVSIKVDCPFTTRKCYQVRISLRFHQC